MAINQKPAQLNPRLPLQRLRKGDSRSNISGLIKNFCRSLKTLSPRSSLNRCCEDFFMPAQLFPSQYNFFFLPVKLVFLQVRLRFNTYCFTPLDFSYPGVPSNNLKKSSHFAKYWNQLNHYGNIFLGGPRESQQRLSRRSWRSRTTRWPTRPSQSWWPSTASRYCRRSTSYAERT